MELCLLSFFLFIFCYVYCVWSRTSFTFSYKPVHSGSSLCFSWFLSFYSQKSTPSFSHSVAQVSRFSVFRLRFPLGSELLGPKQHICTSLYSVQPGQYSLNSLLQEHSFLKKNVLKENPHITSWLCLCKLDRASSTKCHKNTKC